MVERSTRRLRVSLLPSANATASTATLPNEPVVQIPISRCDEFYWRACFTCDNEAHLGTFYLTDSLVCHVDGLIWKKLGLYRHPSCVIAMLAMIPLDSFGRNCLRRLKINARKAAR